MGERDSEVNIGGTGTFGITQSGFKEQPSRMDSTELFNERRENSNAALLSASTQKSHESREDALKHLERENQFLMKKVGAASSPRSSPLAAHRLRESA